MKSKSYTVRGRSGVPVDDLSDLGGKLFHLPRRAETKKRGALDENQADTEPRERERERLKPLPGWGRCERCRRGGRRQGVRGRRNARGTRSTAAAWPLPHEAESASNRTGTRRRGGGGRRRRSRAPRWPTSRDSFADGPHQFPRTNDILDREGLTTGLGQTGWVNEPGLIRGWPDSGPRSQWTGSRTNSKLIWSTQSIALTGRTKWAARPNPINTRCCIQLHSIVLSRWDCFPQHLL